MMLSSQFFRRSARYVAPRAAFFSTEKLELGVGRAKTSTGLTGLDVDYEAVPKMVVKYQAILDKMAASEMPEWYQYRINIEKICRYRIQACLDHPDDAEKVEEICNCGQVEELVEQADDEMTVLDMILENRWWEKISPEAIEVEDDPDHDKTADEVDWEEVPEESNTKA